MRLWSIAPRYLDAKGLTACWREALLARKVMEGKTKGYKHHPQLARFRAKKDQLKIINIYLYTIYLEAKNRNYHFDDKKIQLKTKNIKPLLAVNSGQLDYEFKHLQKKLKKRDLNRYKLNLLVEKVKPNQIFKVVKGGIEFWEK